MSSPIQSGDDEYEFEPIRGDGEALEPESIAAYVTFVVFFVALVGVGIFYLWRTGRCRSKCEDEENRRQKNDDDNEDDDVENGQKRGALKGKPGEKSTSKSSSHNSVKENATSKKSTMTTTTNSSGLPRRSSFDDVGKLNAFLDSEGRS